MLIRLLLILLLSFYGSLRVVGDGNGCVSTADSAVLVISEENDTRKDGLTDGIDRRQPDHEAVLSNRQPSNRIGSSRTPRLIPGQGSKSDRATSRFGTSYTYRSTLFSYYDGRRRLETAPYPSVASSAYYVYALRRILC